MKILNTKFRDVKIIKYNKFIDSRGDLKVTYNKKMINWVNLVFDYTTVSKKNVVRGFHFQWKQQQDKLISVVKGKILDCIIDLRKNSKTFGKQYSVILSEKNCKSLFIPKGFAHACYTLGDINVINCKQSNYYNPKYEGGIIWNDKKLNIKWPGKKPIISTKDKKQKNFQKFLEEYKYL
jgi:dTDP-4-dehydrorhamnose 3,5-epimerase